MEYKPTIGLEIHVELKTQTKMFCGCLNDPNENHPNINVCPVCMGHPGTLPVINKEAVKNVLTLGRALNGKIAEYARFDRKNYFYPDLPKGYQISQYQHPLVMGGELNGVKITRIHLEEDAGSLSHKHSKSLINYNRAGLPLMELVTEPVISNGKEAHNFAQELQLILRYLDISNADMEKGQMRVEVNISLREIADNRGLSAQISTDLNPHKSALLGTKVEIKNLNSFRAVEESIDFEIKRQREVLERGDKIVQETRGWDENKGITFSQRKKEESHNYRYFPEPDLPPLNLKKSDFLMEIRFPELPVQKRKRFKEEFNLKDEQIEILISDKKLADFFEESVSELKDKKMANLLANYVITDLLGLSVGGFFAEILITPKNFAELINMIENKEINSRVAKDVLKIMMKKGGHPSVIVKETGLEQISDNLIINNLVEEIIRENKSVVDDYKKGKTASLQFLVGQAMKKTKGSVNPEILIEKLKEKIA